MAADTIRAGPSQERRSRRRVLVVDDSQVVRTIVACSLRSAGYELDMAEDGMQAVEMLARDSYDVVVTDIEMPNLDGFGVLEAVKKRALTTEVVILTGSRDIGTAIRALRLGAHDFLTKPPGSPDEVVLTVDRAAEKRQLREANLRLMKELEDLSRTDPLTGVPNRRVFEEALVRDTSRAERYGYPMSLIMLDLDHFKRINDEHGHQAGDAVLRLFTRRADRVLRESDAIHRYGGEEFAVLLPHTPYEGAIGAARRLVDCTSRTPFRVGARILNITVSAGVGALGGAKLGHRDLVARADRALYEAKRAGRNRVAGSPPPTEVSSARRAAGE